MHHKESRATLGGKLSAVLVAAGSSVGLGNIWRFPYVAGDNGGGAFLIIYILCVLLLGLPLMIAEFSVGRASHLNAVGAYRKLNRRWSFLGYNGVLAAFLILGFYFVVSGWTAEYMVHSATGEIARYSTAEEYKNLFETFISNPWRPVLYTCLFVLATHFVIALGVQKGIENASRLMMPVLAVLIVVIALYSLTIPGALAGLKYYLMPDFSQFSASTVLGACGQMFYSMSLAMGITITYGSYMPKENLLEHSVTQIEIFDTLFAFFAGLMIIPSVIAFNGGDPSQVNSGPSLMFISLPMVFDSMKFGTVIGAVFFLLVLFAALTSSIALMETLASVIMDKFKLKRIPATLIIIAVCLVVGMLSCLGYGPWESVTIIGMQFLDFFDFISNSVLMPIVAVLTCVLIGHVVGTKVVADEVKSGAGSFRREKLHRVMIRWIAPVLLVAILASELASKIFGVFSI